MVGGGPVTVYNKYVDANSGAAYQRTVIRRAQWEEKTASTFMATGGSVRANTVMVYIPQAVGENYLRPAAWKDLDEKDRPDHWTLKPDDLIVKGEVTDEIDDNYTVTQLRADHDSVMKIVSVDSKDFGGLAVNHWQVMAQ